jgi:hypothetical protein
MGTKKYSSYAQIDRELEILKIEKISYQKSCLGFHRTKESNAESFIVAGSFKTVFSSSFGNILNVVVHLLSIGL